MKAARFQYQSLLLSLALVAGFGIFTSPLAAAPYQPQSIKPATNGSRFLFVLDISAPMKGTDAANRQALFDMIFSGMDGQMQDGDSFGLWLFNEEVKAGEFPLQVWESDNPLEVASRAAQYVRAQKYSGKPDFENLLPRMMQLARAVRDVHLVLITTGEQPLRGTPFDANINEAYARKQAERKKQQKPLITTLNVRTGKVVTASVTLPGEFIQLPPRPVPIVPVVAAPVIETNKVIVQAAPPPPEPRTSAATTAVEPGPTTKVWTPTSTTTNAGPRAKVVQITTLSNVPGPGAEAALSQNTTAAPTPVEPAPVATLPPDHPAAATLAPVEPPAAPPPASSPQAIPVVAREMPTTSTTINVPAGVLVIQPGISSTVLLAIGAALLAACLGLLVLVLRRLRPPGHGSFITQSMERR